MRGKMRLVMVVDYDSVEGVLDAAKIQERGENLVDLLQAGDPRVVFHDCKVQQRRGEGRPDLKKVKLRTS